MADIGEPLYQGADVNCTALRHVLSELGADRATGALHVAGTPGGVLYLVAGRLTYAESPSVPGVGERLVASGRLAATVWKAAYAEGRAARRVGRTLIRDGHLGQHELAARVAATICDTTHALLRGDDEAALRFVPDERHWLGEVTEVELGTLIQDAALRIRSAPAADLPWAGRPHPAWRRRNEPDYAALRRIRQSVKAPGENAHRVRPLLASRLQDGSR